jgi:hypothetical protein
LAERGHRQSSESRTAANAKDSISDALPRKKTIVFNAPHIATEMDRELLWHQRHAIALCKQGIGYIENAEAGSISLTHLRR